MPGSQEDNLEFMFLECPHCHEVLRAYDWVTFAVATTDTSISFSFGAKPMKADCLICPRCRKDCNYLDIIETIRKDVAKGG